MYFYFFLYHNNNLICPIYWFTIITLFIQSIGFFPVISEEQHKSFTKCCTCIIYTTWFTNINVLSHSQFHYFGPSRQLQVVCKINILLKILYIHT